MSRGSAVQFCRLARGVDFAEMFLSKGGVMRAIEYEGNPVHIVAVS